MLNRMYRRFEELDKLHFFARHAKRHAKVEVLQEVTDRDGRVFPLYAFSFGDPNPEHPVFIISGGVHGLEKVGTHLATFFMRTFLARVRWDEDLKEQLKRARLCFIPLVNPVGMYHHRRSNDNGVDLMRNAPIDGDCPPRLLGGHRIGPWLPWYRGEPDVAMEKESQAVVDFCRREIMDASVSMTIDLHSGFGMRDRLWYPYAKTREDFINKRESLRVVRLLKRNLPYHIYTIEAQSQSYTTHGDLWDYLHQLHYEKNQGQKLYLPWTLEMGSWTWVRKNPWQIFSLLGGFNPVLPHRYKRTMRRHVALFEFFFRAILNHQVWFRP